MDLWITEHQTPHLGLTTRVKATLYSGRSEFQEVVVVDTEQFGRMLILDGVYQTSILDEFVYHEMIVHVPMFTHRDPKKVLVIGGGDGGSIREVLRHKGVEQAEMVEIDGVVVDVAKKFLPEISSALNNPDARLLLKIGDGIGHMSAVQDEYDVIIVDCSYDPIGPGEGLFTKQFYQDVYKALKPDGLFVQQTESPWYHQDLIRRLSKDVQSLFPISKMYLAAIPIYPGGLHCFTIGSKRYDPVKASATRIPDFPTRYYNPDIHKSCFALPNFIKELVKLY